MQDEFFVLFPRCDEVIGNCMENFSVDFRLGRVMNATLCLKKANYVRYAQRWQPRHPSKKHLIWDLQSHLDLREVLVSVESMFCY
jgi:hypothetical protein